MYRIQLASGNEAVYRSLEELAVSVQNGIICPDALVYHRKTGSWLPIETHPHYHVARELVLPERMRPLLDRSRRSPNRGKPASQARPVPGVRHKPRAALPADRVESPASPKQADDPDAGGKQEPLPDPSRSFVDSLRRTDAGGDHGWLSGLSDFRRGYLGIKRSRRSWLMAAALSGLTTVGWILYSPSSDDSPSGMIVAGMDAAGTATNSGPTRPVVTPSPELPPADEGEMSYREAYRQARAGFEEGMASFGFEDLFSESHISSAEGLRSARRLVASARNVVAAYRGQEVRIDQAFAVADSSLRESYGIARSVDSLFSAIDSIYSLLQTAEGRYSLRRGRIAFDDPLVTARYVGQAIWLEARLRGWNRNPARTPLTIRPIVAAVGRVPRSQTGF